MYVIRALNWRRHIDDDDDINDNDNENKTKSVGLLTRKKTVSTNRVLENIINRM